MTDPNDTLERPPEVKERGRYSPWAKLGLFLVTLGLLLAIGVFGYAYRELATVNVSLAHMITRLENRLNNNQANLVSTQQTVADLTTNFAKSKDYSLEQQKILENWHQAQQGNLDKWYVAEAQYLVRMANDHLLFAREPNMSLSMLKEADQSLAKSKDPHVIELRQSIAKDIANLQAVPEVDTTSLYLQLTTLNQHIDQLSLPPALQAANEQSIIPADLPWWKKGLEYSLQGLRKIVIVRKTADNNSPFLLPDEKSFLYQNLHAQNENVIWAVLHRNPEVYQQSLGRMQTWISHYFDQTAPLTKTVLQNIANLMKVDIKPPQTSFAPTLQLFQNYFARQETSTQVVTDVKPERN